MEGRSPAQVYALVFGVVLVAAGVLGFFYESSFSTGDDVYPENVDKVLDILDVNGWHNVVHIATGALGLAVAGSYANARLYALGLGAVYIALDERVVTGREAALVEEAGDADHHEHQAENERV